MATRSSSLAAREFFSKNHDLSAPMSFVDAVVYAFLYEFLTYDDDEASIEKIDALLAALSQHSDPEISAFFSDATTGAPLALDKEKYGDAIMDHIRKAIAEEVVADANLVDDSAVYKTLLLYCSALYGSPEWRRYHRLMLEDLENVFYEEGSPGRIAQPESFTDEHWAMPNIGDGGQTGLTPMDLTIFLALVNNTKIVTKAAIDHIAVKGPSKDERGAYRGWIGSIERYILKMKGDDSAFLNDPSAFIISNQVGITLSDQTETHSTYSMDMKKLAGEFGPGKLPYPREYYPVMGPARPPAAGKKLMAQRGNESSANWVALDDATVTAGTRYDDPSEFKDAASQVAPGWSGGWVTSTGTEVPGTQRVDGEYFQIAQTSMWTIGDGEADRFVKYWTTADPYERARYFILNEGWNVKVVDHTGPSPQPEMYGLNKAIANSVDLRDLYGVTDFKAQATDRIATIMGNVGDGSWDVVKSTGEKPGEGDTIQVSYTWQPLEVKWFDISSNGDFSQQAADTVMEDMNAIYVQTKTRSEDLAKRILKEEKESGRAQHDATMGGRTGPWNGDQSVWAWYWSGWEDYGDVGSWGGTHDPTGRQVINGVWLNYATTPSIKPWKKPCGGVVEVVGNYTLSAKNKCGDEYTRWAGDTLYIPRVMDFDNLESVNGPVSIAAYTSRIIARLARCYPKKLSQKLKEVLASVLIQAEQAAEKKKAPPVLKKKEEEEFEVPTLEPFDLQCFLVQNIRALSTRRDKILQDERGTGLYTNLSAVVEASTLSVGQTDNVDGPNRGMQPGNLISYINHGGRTDEIRALLNLCPDAYALLTPYIKVYRVDYEDENRLVPKRETEIPFPSFIDPKDVSQLLTGRYSGAGVTSFAWNLVGVNPAEVENNISANLKMRFQTLYDLFSLNQSLQAGDTSTAGYLDLIIGSRTLNREQAVEAPHVNPRVGSNCLDLAPQMYEGENFRVKITAGWSTPPGFENMQFRNFQKSATPGGTSFGALISKAIENSKISLYLQTASHQLNFEEDGSVELSVDYVASLDGILRAPNADIFIGGAEFDEAVKSLREKTKEAYEVINERAAIGADLRTTEALEGQADEEREKLEKLVRKNKSEKYKRFLCNLYDRGQIQMLSVPVSELQRVEDLTPEERQSIARRRLDPNGDYLAIDAATRSASSKEIDRLYSDAKLAVDAGAAEKEGDLSDDDILDVAFGRVKETGEADAGIIDIPYFYLGDMIDGVLQYLTNVVADDNGLNGSFQMSLGTVELLDPLMAFKYPEVTIDCGPDIGTVVKSLADIDPLRFKGAHQLSFYTNIGSLPISLDYFQDWFVAHIVRPQRETYTFLNFVKQICSSLIGRAFNSKCFGDALNFNVGFDTATFAFDKSFTGKLVTPEELASAKTRAQEKARIALSTDDDQKPNIPSLVLYSRDSRPSVSHIEDENISNGIYHYYMGASCGLAKKISFHRNDMAYFREARIARKGALGATQLRELYNVSIDMIGNTLHKNGQYIKVDPVAIGVGPLESEGTLPNLAQLLGIGGYYLVTGVESEVSSTGFDVRITGMQEGITLDEGTIMPLSDPQEGDSSDPKSNSGE